MGIRYYKTYEKAINGAISFLTLGEVTLVGDGKTIMGEFDECKKKIDIFAKNIDAQMKDKEIWKSLPAIKDLTGYLRVMRL